MAITVTEIRAALDVEARGGIDHQYTSDVDLARRLIVDLTVSGISGNGNAAAPISARGHLHLYNDADGTWAELDVDTLQSLIQLYSEVPVIRQTRSGEVQSRLKLSEHKLRSITKCALTNPDVYQPEFFEGRRTGIAFANGFVTVNEHAAELEDHSPDNRATVSMPFDYDPEAECGEWLAVLDRVFEPDKDRDEKKRALQEFAGACVTGIACDYSRCLVLLGEGENGKSTVAETISELLFPREQVTHVPPQTWGREYNLSAMRQARINVASEIPESDILNSPRSLDTSFPQTVCQGRSTTRTVSGGGFWCSVSTATLGSIRTRAPRAGSSNGSWQRHRGSWCGRSPVRLASSVTTATRCRARTTRRCGTGRWTKTRWLSVWPIAALIRIRTG